MKSPRLTSATPITLGGLALASLALLGACKSGSGQPESDYWAGNPQGLADESPRAESGYRLPPQEVVDIVDAPVAPGMILSPSGEHALMAHRYPLPSIAELAEPMLRLAGMRIQPDKNARRTTRHAYKLEILDVKTGEKREVSLPKGTKMTSPSWSPNGEHFAFTRSTDTGLELWIGNAERAEARRLTNRKVNDTYGTDFTWNAGSDSLIAQLIPRRRGAAPEPPRIPSGPIVDETQGDAKTNRTYQDLLQNPYDEALFEYYCTSQLARIELDGDVTEIGRPSIFAGVSPSPDGEHLLVTRVHGPYSYVVPAGSFARDVEVWDQSGKREHIVATLPVADEVPIGGVRTGPRRVSWQPLQPATLFWAEALDGGDPKQEVEYRDQMFTLAAPFDGEPQAAGRVEHRFSSVQWTDLTSVALFTEYDRKRRWTKTTLRDVRQPDAEPQVLFDRSTNDAYNDPGRPITHRLADGKSVVLLDEGWMYLSGAGYGPDGQRPFLDRHNLRTGVTERVFRSPLERYTAFAGFVGAPNLGRGEMIFRAESATEPPNYYLYDGAREEFSALTEFPDPHPQLTGIKKELVTYNRKDGVPLSGTLYLPADYEQGERLPLVVWAYPREYNDIKTAGQVRSTTNRFTRLAGTSQLMFLTQGYAVLDRAAMPVVGDPETMNDSFAEQIVDAAQAAIDAMAAKGVADPNRVGVGGHSYGAFMTANLLAHCDLFQAGIARSGAYNRSLTPFGFQSERRTLWQATDAYVAISPFFQADQIDEPMLLIHGEVDNNSGTFPIQSKRLFHAMQGLGGTARYVRLPHESHGYAARESVLHVLAESFAWFDEHVKGAGGAPSW